jgi:hypothetical protein
MKYWEIIADNLSKAGSNCCVSALDSRGRATFVADAHLDDGKWCVVWADEELTAFMGTGIGGKTGLRQRHELALVRSERVPEICSAKRRHDEKTERKSPKTSLSFVVLLRQQKLRQRKPHEN